MVLRLIYLVRNLTRNLPRTILTCAAVALPMVIFVLSAAVVNGVEGFLDNAARQLRLAVTHRASVVNPLPEGYRAKIESLDPTRQHLLAVCGVLWIGGKQPNNPQPLSTVGVDGDTFAAAFPDLGLTAEEVARWERDRQAIAVGRGTAGQMGWKVGDRITIQPSVPPYTPMDFHVISTLPGATDAVTNWCHRSYIEEELKRIGAPYGQVSFFFAKCASQADLDRYRQRIDELFLRSPDETKTQDEKAFMSEFITQQFDLPRNLRILAAVTVFVAVMAAANTMSMNFRDRINEYATLKSMGFRSGYVFAMIQTESLALCLVGGLLGAIGPYVAFMHTPLKDYTVPVILHLEIPRTVCAQAVAISLSIGVVAGAWPCWQAVRMKAVAALRSLE